VPHNIGTEIRVVMPLALCMSGYVTLAYTLYFRPLLSPHRPGLRIRRMTKSGCFTFAPSAP
jgi:hypothetical protein